MSREVPNIPGNITGIFVRQLAILELPTISVSCPLNFFIDRGLSGYKQLFSGFSIEEI